MERLLTMLGEVQLYSRAAFLAGPEIAELRLLIVDFGRRFEVVLYKKNCNHVVCLVVSFGPSPPKNSQIALAALPCSAFCGEFWNLGTPFGAAGRGSSPQGTLA